LEVVVAPDGTPVLRNVERATVRSRAKLAYETTTKADLVPEAVELARRVTEAEDRRGAFRVELDEQEVVLDPALPLGVAVRFAARAESEDLNACVSLAANMAVANAMIERGAGLAPPHCPLSRGALDPPRIAAPSRSPSRRGQPQTCGVFHQRPSFRWWGLVRRVSSFFCAGFGFRHHKPNRLKRQRQRPQQRER
jgi:hypothetical protein